ncbi:nitrate- and nitrite sensing domain-containing protein [Actinoplanes sp. ATCC 53533]|uniref:sensor histidine kinase n=1 Tax=Actinoplanes sp. ATCC 53533 TaxID=1288362 RepID=UPI001F265427|nr:nitrate- and nitrite sensing domain-containing protein [Actinoplanes sp. ATCC 53533]
MKIPRPRQARHDADITDTNNSAAYPPESAAVAAAPAPGAGGSSIRRRVVRTLTLPVVAVLVLLGVITVTEVGNYRTAAASARAVTLVLAVQDLVQELQTERGLTAGLLGGNVGFRAELAPARKRVDDQRAKVEDLISSGGVAQDRVATAVSELDGLAGVRAGTDAGAADRAPTFTFYTGRIAELSSVDYGLDSSADPALRRGVAALEALGDAKESTAQERAFLNGVFSASGFNRGEFLQFATMRSAKDAALASFTRYADETQRKAKDYVLSTGAAQVASYFENVALNAGDGRNLQVNPQSWWSALTTVLDDMLQLQQHVGSVIQARAAVLQDAATRRMGLLVGAVIICFIGSVYLATVASRSIAAPLATLADEANRLAGERLPEAVRKAISGDDDAPPLTVPVPPGASDEVRRVADALDRVQATAYSLATEQAMLRRSTTESLANLGRRNQNLLRRQLGFITSLEREESDPTGLANLFELDHLATRMRRNAESLLVLVGAASPRQWSDPLPIADVIRAAVSEVEEYRRVALRRVDDALVAGAVVSGVAHMLAELVENGLAFSPPDADVEIQGRRIGDSYLIAITDQGIGMGRADLELANQRLRGEGDFITAPTRFLGHYVVGRLATDMDIDVQLAPSPVTGVTARIVLPPSIVAGNQAVTGSGRPARPADEERLPAVDSPRALEASDPAATQVLTLPSAEQPTALDSRIRPGTIEYVTVPGSPAVRRQPADVEPVGAGSPTARYEDAMTTSTMGMDMYSFAPPPDESERTPNGLKKRAPKARKTANSGPGKAGGTAPTRTAERPAPVSDSPDEVRARLTAFRSGMQRGSTESTDQL